MSNNVLITGGAGFIGSSLTAMCAARGMNVVVLDALTYAGSRANISGVKCELVVGDIADEVLTARLLREHNITAILHLAAESHVDNSITGPGAFIDTNITGTYKLLDSALKFWKELNGKARADFRFIYVSTDEVYGSLGPVGYFSETTAIAPNSPYSASKAAGDHLARAWFETYGLPTLTTHCSNNYGPRQHNEKLIPHMIACAIGGKKLPVYGDGKNIRDWIHVEDHCTGLLLALIKGKPGEVYNFGGRAEVENITLVQRLCSLLDSKHPRADGKSYAEQISFVTDRLGHDRRYAIDDSKAEKELGFTRAYDFEAGLAATVEWYLKSYTKVAA